ncbi:MAG: M20 family metallopeptidase [Candidatus Muiribacteriota bacterium]
MLLNILEKLVEIKSFSREEQNIITFLSNFLRKHNIEYELQPVYSKSHGNIIAYAGRDFTNPVLFTSHIDTVPASVDKWNTPPFEMVKDGNKIYGRGVNDNKGAAAAMLSVLLKLAKNPCEQGFIFAFTVDEEGDSTGVFELIKHPVVSRAVFALVGELCFDEMYKDVFKTYPSVWMGGFGRPQFKIECNNFFKLASFAVDFDGVEGKQLTGESYRSFNRVRNLNFCSSYNKETAQKHTISFTPRHGSGKKMNNPVVAGVIKALELMNENYTIHSFKCIIEGDKYFLSMPSKIEIFYGKRENKKDGQGEIIVDRNTVSNETQKMSLKEIKEAASEMKVKLVKREMPYLSGWKNAEKDNKTKRCLSIIEEVFNKQLNKVYKMGPCDANVLCAHMGIPSVVFGPAGGNVHSHNEFVYYDSLKKIEECFKRIALKI